MRLTANQVSRRRCVFSTCPYTARGQRLTQVERGREQGDEDVASTKDRQRALERARYERVQAKIARQQAAARRRQRIAIVTAIAVVVVGGGSLAAVLATSSNNSTPKAGASS